MALTNAQRNGLDKLKAAQPFKVTAARMMRTRSGARVEIPAIIKTGVNTAVLSSLRDMGLISVSHIWLSGHVEPDLTITEAGMKA